MVTEEKMNRDIERGLKKAIVKVKVEHKRYLKEETKQLAKGSKERERNRPKWTELKFKGFGKPIFKLKKNAKPLNEKLRESLGVPRFLYGK